MDEDLAEIPQLLKEINELLDLRLTPEYTERQLARLRADCRERGILPPGEED